MAMKLGDPFYLRDDVLAVSRDLLGKVLCTGVGGKVTSAMITETEAYAGVDDRASHAYGNRRTRRTEPMFHRGGIAYVYLCYGIHHLFNVVTADEDTPHAVLIRAGKVVEGGAAIATRRGLDVTDKRLLAGPGSLAKGLGIHRRDSGTALTGSRIWIEDRDIKVPDEDVRTGPRVGVGYAGVDADLPYRFVWHGPPPPGESSLR
jgi:DNA-3-methyladenine glycosylase